MVKKVKNKKRDVGEIEATKKYFNILKQVSQEKGLLPAIGYDVKSTVYSVGKRISNLFAPSVPFYDANLAEGLSQEQYRSLKKRIDKSQKKNADRRKKERIDYILRGEKGLQKKVVCVLTIVGLCTGLFFLSPNLTGNAIGDLTNSTSNWIGGVLFVFGLIGVFTFFKKKKF